jgi:tetratricopeptide (TPR) repeat protein
MGSTLLKVYFICFALFLELVGGFIWIVQGRFYFFVLLHLLSAVLISLLVIGSYYRGSERNLWLFSGAVWGFVPVFGSVVAMLVFVLLQGREEEEAEALHNLALTIDEDENYFREMSFEIISEKYGDEFSWVNLNDEMIDPIIDILKSDDRDSKEKAVKQLRAIESNDSIRLLQLAQKDKSYDIQYLSTLALLSIEEKWHHKIKSLGRQVQHEPKNTKIRNEIVEIYMRLYESGLVSERIASTYLNHALEHIILSLQLDPKQPEMHAQLGKVHLCLSNYASAEKAFSQAIDEAPNNIDYRLYRAEVYYYCKNYSKLKEDCEFLISTGNLSSRAHESIKYWSSHAA